MVNHVDSTILFLSFRIFSNSSPWYSFIPSLRAERLSDNPVPAYMGINELPELRSVTRIQCNSFRKSVCALFIFLSISHLYSISREVKLDGSESSHCMRTLRFFPYITHRIRWLSFTFHGPVYYNLRRRRFIGICQLTCRASLNPMRGNSNIHSTSCDRIEDDRKLVSVKK